MPWMWITILIVSLYVLVKLVQGVIELANWWTEGRETARLQKEWLAKRRDKREKS